MKEDEIRADFTIWLERLVYRARIDFIRKEAKYASTFILIGDLEERVERDEEKDHWDFECEWLKIAFQQLTISQQRILKMIYFEGKTPLEVANALGCTRQHIYNRCSQAYKHIRRYKKELSK